MHNPDEINGSPRMFRALALMEKQVPPTLYGHKAYLRAPIAPPSKNAFVPSWTWTGIQRDLPEDEHPITLDINGAFLAALGSVPIAHSQLKNAGAWDPYAFRRSFDRSVLPGYYLVDVIDWKLNATLVSPLGTSPALAGRPAVWVAHPTLVLLLELLEEGAIGQLTIHDSWVSTRVAHFRDWSARLKQARNHLLDNVAKADTEDEIRQAKLRYRAFKEGYGAAFSMMLTGEKCETRRPDWAHAVYAQHAATSWRKAWRFTLTGPVLAMGAVDSMTVLRSDLAKVVQSEKPAIRLDPSGRTLGHMKEKDDEPTDEPTAQQLAADVDFVTADTFGDVL